jgi:hypothetical protein
VANEEKDPQNSQKEKPTPKGLTVTMDGEKKPISDDKISKAHFADIAKIDAAYSDKIPLQLEDGLVYIYPAFYSRCKVNEKINPQELQKIRDGVVESVYQFQLAWLKLGSLLLLVHKAKLYEKWGYEKFSDYCEGEVKLRQSAVYEIMKSTAFLLREQRPLYDEIVAKKEKSLSVPSYRCFYLLASKQKQLKDKEQFQTLLESLSKGHISTRDFAQKIREALKDKKKAPSKKAIVRQCKSLYKDMQQAKISQEIIKEAKSLLEKLQTLIAKPERSEKGKGDGEKSAKA